MNTAVDAMRVSVLGPLEVSDAAGRPVRIGGYRVRALFILLALDAGRVIPSHALIGKLWPEGSPARPADAANALQSLVSRLRQALRQAGIPEGILESSANGYRLNVTPAAVDALAFEEQAKVGGQALARGDAHEAVTRLTTALGTWRGSALADVANEQFAFASAARLNELQITAILDRVEAEITLGRAGAATIGELRELTASDQLAERPAALLMRALAATGRQSEALAVYQRTRNNLADRLGVDPSSRLERAYLAILRQEIPQTAAPGEDQAPARVRRPPTSFVGRDGDVAAVVKRLRTERLVTLTGPGGVGKTRLAMETTRELTVPVWFAELAPVTNPAEVPFAVIGALGLRERSIAPRSADKAGDPVDRLCAALADRSAVLILDNCEHVIDEAAALVARILTDCPQVKVLATSREPLQIPGETLHVVDPLATFPAVRLFADRAAAVLPGFGLSPANTEVIARICRTLDGIPLAIELATPWLRTLTPAQLAARLDDRFALLTVGSRNALPRHQTLRAVVDWSWELLSERQRVLSRRLAVFPGGVTLGAAERVCSAETAQGEPAQGEPGQGEPGRGRSPLPASAVLPTLADLVGKSLLSKVDTGDDTEPRYRMLDTVRAYAAERLAEAGEDAATRDAAARYFLDRAEAADPQLRARDQARWFRVLTSEQDNLNAAIRWSVARADAGTALRFVRALGYYWVQRGHGEADALAREILALPPPPLTPPLAEGRVICALLAAGWSWELDRTRQPLQEAIAALSGFGPDYETTHPLVAMAEPLLMSYDGDMGRAQRYFERYLTARDPWLRAMGKLYCTSYAYALGDLKGAEESTRAGLAELRALGEQWGVAMALAQLAEFTEVRADHAASIEALTEAVAIGRELGVWGDLTYVEGRLAVIRARAGDLDRAREELAQAQRGAESRGGAVDTDRWVAFMQAELASLGGDYAEAARCCESVLTTITTAGNAAPWWESLRAIVKARLAIAVLRQGDEARCATLLAQSLDAAANWCEHSTLATVLDACAVYAQSRGDAPDPELAARLLGSAAAVRGAFDESSLDAPVARRLAVAALGEKRYTRAYSSQLTSSYASAIALAGQLLTG